ncbi:MAG TPA: MerR family transcriptional regulator [Solirubrobacteraceae bacterium]|nr:MerR family transcriptional regulator [Solirubrobacteraceae bacterium]
MKTVGEVAELAGVTVRALHHYDELGLLSPRGRSEAGYRLYSDADLARLREILIWRQLGFALSEIQALLDEPGHDRIGALERQRELVDRDLERLSAVAGAIEAALEAERRGTRMEETTMFDGFDPSEYEDEARERWGHTDAYQEAARRTRGYGDAEWAQIRAESDAIVNELVALMRAGEPADGAAARALAERHREHISRWFYPCSVQMHRGLGEMYVADERFARNYEQLAPGLAAHFRDAIAANAGEGTVSR